MKQRMNVLKISGNAKNVSMSVDILKDEAQSHAGSPLCWHETTFPNGDVVYTAKTTLRDFFIGPIKELK